MDVRQEGPCESVSSSLILYLQQRIFHINTLHFLPRPVFVAWAAQRSLMLRELWFSKCDDVQVEKCFAHSQHAQSNVHARCVIVHRDVLLTSEAGGHLEGALQL